VITTFLRLYLALTSTLTLDARTLEEHDERAHHACEVTVYAIVAPELADDPDETTPLGEALAEVLCRHDPAPTIVVPGCTCTLDESYDCDGPDGDECVPWDCAGENDACDAALAVACGMGLTSACGATDLPPIP
jgi:hypothetical protein